MASRTAHNELGGHADKARLLGFAVDAIDQHLDGEARHLVYLLANCGEVECTP